MQLRERASGMGVLLVAFGCGGDTAPSSAMFSAVDSGGITITINSLESVSGAPSISLVEELQVGSVAGREEELFGNVFDVAVDPSGSIYVLDISARTVRVFDSAGAPLRTIGQAGEGPGEFAWEPLSIAVSDDTVAVLDRFRLHLFSTDGDFLHSTQQSFAGNEPTHLWTKAGESWVVGRLVRPSSAPGASRVVTDSLRVLRVDLEAGEANAVVASVPGGLRWYVENGGRSFPQLQGSHPSAAADPSGDVYATSGSSYEILVFSLEGELVRILRSDLAARPLPPSEADRMVARMVGYYDSVGIGSMADGYQRAYDVLGAPETRPILGRIFAAADGSVLVERVDLDPEPLPITRGDPSTWDILGRDGRIVGRLVVGPDIRVEQFNPNHIYVVERDDLGVQYVVRYRVDRP